MNRGLIVRAFREMWPTTLIIGLLLAAVEAMLAFVLQKFGGQMSEQWLQLDFARGILQAPLCTDCHGEHKILKHTNEASQVNAAHIRDTCGSCHGDVRLSRKFGLPGDRLVSFDSSFHGLAGKSGSQTVANCASCHGVHNILPSNDPKSTIHAKNLPQTCGKCHPGAGSRTYCSGESRRNASITRSSAQRLKAYSAGRSSRIVIGWSFQNGRWPMADG